MTERNDVIKSIAQNADELSLEDFSYDLPSELIAHEPVESRSSSRLLLLDRRAKKLEHSVFSSLPSFLREGDCLVLNDTKVIPARILANRKSGGAVDILLLKAETQKQGLWQAMASPLKKLKEGEELVVSQSGKDFVLHVAGFQESSDGQRRVLLDFGSNANLFTLLHEIGRVPLPPYILKERESRSSKTNTNDLERYQTVYANSPGAVAAPTAGLHFSHELLGELAKKGIKTVRLTLHVGPGTFKPITSSVAEHTVEEEEFCITQESAETINQCRKLGGRIIAVGTTSCRALETAASEDGILEQVSKKSSLYIRPGYKFKIVDALITNFHLSRSSLLVLVCAFAGHSLIMQAYKTAIQERYRFYSYGDAMFIT